MQEREDDIVSDDFINDQFHGVPTYNETAKTKRLGKYELVRLLGRGGMGEVWLARDTVADVEVAIKTLPPELRDNEEAQEQIRTSYQRVYKLGHPNICAVKDLVLHEGGAGLFLVMDYFDGTTLSKYRSQYVAEHGQFPLSEVVRLLAPVAKALDHAHSIGLAHRDIKPSNIMVSRDGKHVRLIDFQLAAEIRTTVSRFTNMQVDTSGTYPYMAPEQLRGQRANAKTDVYALAMVAYELLAGQLPFESHSWEQWRTIVNDETIAIPEIEGTPKEVHSAMLLGLAKSPETRAPTCSDFLDAFLKSPTGVQVYSADKSKPLCQPLSNSNNQLTHLLSSDIVASKNSFKQRRAMGSTLDVMFMFLMDSILILLSVFVFCAGVALISTCMIVNVFSGIFMMCCAVPVLYLGWLKIPAPCLAWLKRNNINITKADSTL